MREGGREVLERPLGRRTEGKRVGGVKNRRRNREGGREDGGREGLKRSKERFGRGGIDGRVRS